MVIFLCEILHVDLWLLFIKNYSFCSELNILFSIAGGCW